MKHSETSQSLFVKFGYIVIFTAMMLMVFAATQAQTTVKVVGNQLVSNNASALPSDTSITKNSVVTEFTFAIPSGEVLKVWKSVPGGKYYVIRKAKESGKQYRQYLKIEG